MRQMLTLVVGCLVLQAQATPAFALPAAPVSSAAPARSGPPPPTPIEPFAVAAPTVWKLKNGLTVWWLERQRAPLLDVVAVVHDAGAIADPVGQWGLADISAHMLLEGTRTDTRAAFADKISALGAALTTSTDLHTTQLALHATASHGDEALGLMAAAMMQPRLDPADFVRQQNERTSDLLIAAQDPRALAELVRLRALFGASRAGTSVRGTPHDLTELQLDDVKRFHTGHIRPEQTTLVVVAALPASAGRQLIERHFLTWQAEGKKAVVAALRAPPPSAAHVAQLVLPGAPQTVVRVTQSLSSIQPFSPDVDVMNTLLGGSFTSRLNNNLREQHGYSYGASCRVQVVPDASQFVLSTSVATPVTAKALAEIHHELARIRTLPSSEETTRAKNYAAFTFPSTFDRGSDVAEFYADLAARRIALKRVQRYMADTLRVTPPALMAAAARMLDDQRRITVLVGDKAALDTAMPGAKVVTYTAAELLPGLPVATADH